MDIRTRNTLNLKKSQLQTEIDRNKATIERFLQMTEHADFYKNKAAALKTDNAGKEALMAECDRALTTGVMSDALAAVLFAVPEKVAVVKTPRVVAPQKVVVPEVKKPQRPYRPDVVSQFVLDREEERLTARIQRLPDFIKKNLKTMPNNRGYIYSGVWLFGLKPPSGNPNVLSMNEVRKGGSVYHEISETRHVITEKRDGRMVVLADKIRTRISI